MKLIDSDALITAFENTDCDVCEDVGYTAFFGYSPARVSDVIDDAPIVDAVPVVRCKDCKYYPDFEKEFNACPMWDDGDDGYGSHWNGEDDGFCNHGERIDK